MDNYATIIVEKNALPSVKESIAIGKRMLERKLLTYTQKLRYFETTKNMDTPTFIRLFENGELGDQKEWIEWEYIASVVKLLQKKLNDLETLRYEA